MTVTEIAAARFWGRVNKTSTCWLWTGPTDQDGYGLVSIQNKSRRVHRLAYEMLVGPIPEGLTLDHLCRTPSCVNPAHLEPVTSRVNTLRGFNPPAINARKTHCKRGHAYTPENTMLLTKGRRFCRECHRQQTREGLRRLRERGSIR